MKLQRIRSCQKPPFPTFSPQILAKKIDPGKNRGGGGDIVDNLNGLQLFSC